MKYDAKKLLFKVVKFEEDSRNATKNFKKNITVSPQKVIYIMPSSR